MAGLKSMVIVLVVMMVASFQPQFAVAQTRHVVGGDALGWNVPSDSNAYTTWASGQTFRVGDTLVFNFVTGAHDVAEVTEAAYGPCTKTNPMSLNSTGPTTLTLRTPGNHYYICTVRTHCEIGQKVNISVAGSTSTPPSATSPGPSGMPSPPPPAQVPQVPSPSSASAFTAMVPVTFLAAVLALFY